MEIDMKKIRTFAEAVHSLNEARKDFRIVDGYRQVFQNAPVKLLPHDYQFLNGLWGMGDPPADHIFHWRTKLEEKHAELVKYIPLVEDIVKGWKPKRSALPLKQQRVLGMIPQL